MTTAILNYYRIQKNLRVRISSVALPIINWKTVCFVGFFMCSALLVFYVWQMNDLTRGSYLINNYKKQITKFSDENKNLEIFFAESSFMGQALAKIQLLNFQKTTSVKYIQTIDSSAQALEINNKI